MKTLYPLFLGALLAATNALPVFAQLDNILSPVPAAQSASAQPAGATTIRADAPRLGEPELFDRIAASLAKRLALDDGELSLRPVTPWGEVSMPPGAWNITLLDAPDLKGLVSTFYVRFRLEAAGQVIGEWQIPVHAQLTMEVWVATRRLLRGETPEPGTDLEKRALNVLAERDTPLPARTALDGYELTQTVSPGEPLTWRDLAPRALVRRGQLVDVIASEGPFAVSMKALAMQDGANGAMIRVRNVTSQRDITAQVVGDNKVSVKF